MRLGWDDIKRRAKAFSEEWKDAHYEKGETQTFYNEFFEIFGIRRKQVAIYEQRVKLLSNRHGFIDLFWPGTLLVEQKSSRLDLGKAQGQALDYVEGIHPTLQPRWVLTCDFQTWVLLDLDTGKELRFRLADLHKHITAFDFMLGRKVSFETQAGVTITAAELMGKLHDALEESGYVGHDLEQLLVRLLFCLFADDTGIFQPKDIFLQLVENDTRPDGSDVGRVLNDLFDVLDTPEDARQSTLQAELNAFPYVNGRLFAGRLRTPHFTQIMRDHLLDAARHDWSGVSPAIFGSLFQSVMDAKERRAKGAHYTTEANILKVIGPLFLDDLRAELAAIIQRKTGRDKALLEFQAKLTRLTFFDPACGCGNFLVIAYREIRRLELECLKALYGDQQIEAALLSRVTVDQFYGIEYEEFPAKIAEVAMWMMDHIANNEINEAFRLNYARIPLKDSAHILHGDALETDWSSLLRPEKCSYIMGNPPFVGAKYQSEVQRAQVRRVAGLGGSGGTLDYVAAWFIKAGQYLQLNRRIRIAFVATNSITQGEQVAQLWPILFDRHGLEIAFAHRTFSWGSEARGKAHVHVVIIGLAHRDHEPAEKRLFSYPDIKGDPVESRHAALTAYLFDARGVANRHLVVVESTRPLSTRPVISFGNMPNDDGNLILSPSERADLLDAYPQMAPYVRPLYGAKDFIDGNFRYCLWLPGADSTIIRSVPPVVERLRRNREYRAASTRKTTKQLADFPGLFGEIRHTEQPYVLVPRHSSERRDFVPFGFCPADSVAHDSCLFIPNANLFDFAILTSRAHMAWLAHIGGRLKSDFRYSIGLVYNTFPWPDTTLAQRAKIEALAQAVLDARAAHPTSSLADLYDPDTMPANLRKAHAALDAAVDRLYRSAPFASDRDRVEHLFGRYEALVNPLERIGAAKNRRVARMAEQNDCSA
ncbi:SAM-dependent methyltransferase [Tardibacter chloracetimidivorans]|uniref:site-specific DNA-methyltransferase (adenine-specific) n=1 Tax=Tardibacter chloracetimidivorans TaxID=1921510 RepID=A0A1L3ZT39_9SPHN|nr:DNA methyltransferase [Tardibacter chloracetimidivorans]API58803.1 SAM-dependent methyltransferase [Tardibacter chloracetimidivorans]